ncbi:shikimate dehydrogenase [Lederbergia citrea]|uniref:Shikimate dehydrogenase n=1 Tax=Lederbergia citrea TaxID=2833581 RepID=A0A942Z3Q9_9BACI|nr:shikimate dehydrogenase [Lederbergia citrea]MBS4221742.1 shikimate dehydrogenase [Lederbergia citrea]
MKLEKATKPTFYFIGVTTQQSSIMKLFPLWAEELGIDATIKGIDIEIHADKEVYQKVTKFLKEDELSLGALVTTHKIDIYEAASDYFDYLDSYAESFRELSCISKKNGQFRGFAKDPITSGLSLEAFIPKSYWMDQQGEVFIMGAGGSAIAIAAYLLNPEKGDNIPSKVYVSNRSQPRLDSMKDIINTINPNANIEYILAPKPEDNDEILSKLKEYSLIVNATGLGKDRPGSPLSNNCQFPLNSLVWELNYRGSLLFMDQANEQRNEKNLHVEDGWIYFIHGWSQVIAEVFQINLDKDVISRLEVIANSLRK